jgi:hypothetical protein
MRIACKERHSLLLPLFSHTLPFFLPQSLVPRHTASQRPLALWDPASNPIFDSSTNTVNDHVNTVNNNTNTVNNTTNTINRNNNNVFLDYNYDTTSVTSPNHTVKCQSIHLSGISGSHPAWLVRELGMHMEAL